MAKRVLIAPAEGRFEKLLVDRFAKAGFQVLAAGAKENEWEDASVRCCEWEPRSFISSRNLVLTGFTVFDSIDAVVLSHSDRDERTTIHDLSPRDIESGIDVGLKGFFFLLRELIPYLAERRTGHVSFALFRPDDDSSGPLSRTTGEGFASLAQSMFDVYRNAGFTMSAFESKKDDVDGFADFVVRGTMEREGETGGKLLRYGAKPFERLGFSRR